MKKQQKENKSGYTSALWNSKSLGSFFGLDADRGSALAPRGNSSLHTPCMFFQQEKYYPQKKKYTMTEKILSGLKKHKLQSRVWDFFSFNKVQKL